MLVNKQDYVGQDNNFIIYMNNLYWSATENNIRVMPQPCVFICNKACIVIKSYFVKNIHEKLYLQVQMWIYGVLHFYHPYAYHMFI